MKIIKEMSLTGFNFWSGAKDFVSYLTLEELETLESIIEDIYPETIDATTLNDMFWFDQDTLCEWLGLDIDEVYDR